MSKAKLEARLKKLVGKSEELKKRAKASEDVAEVRSIYLQLEELDGEMTELRELIEDCEKEERSTPPADAKLVNGDVKASFSTVQTEKRDKEVDPRATMEYRQAFRKYVTNGEITDELRAGTAIDTSDTGAAIPFTVMNEVINTVRKRYGNLYNKVRKMAVQGGVQIAVGALEAKFKWISESTTSPNEDVGKLGKVTFSYHQAELRVARTFLSDILTLDAFEAEVARVIAIAYLEAMDEAIVKGTGDGMPLGILNDTRVTEEEGHVIEMTDAEFSDWSEWVANVFGIIPMGYANVQLIMTKGTVYSKLRTMKDDVNRPLYYEAMGGRVDDTDIAEPTAYFDGHVISMVEPTILPDFNTAQAGDVVAIVWIPEDYAVNENFGFAMRRYINEETNEIVDKAITVVDGKILNPKGYYLIKKKAS